MKKLIWIIGRLLVPLAVVINWGVDRVVRFAAKFVVVHLKELVKGFVVAATMAGYWFVVSAGFVDSVDTLYAELNDAKKEGLPPLSASLVLAAQRHKK